MQSELYEALRLPQPTILCRLATDLLYFLTIVIGVIASGMNKDKTKRRCAHIHLGECSLQAQWKVSWNICLHLNGRLSS